MEWGARGRGAGYVWGHLNSISRPPVSALINRIRNSKTNGKLPGQAVSYSLFEFFDTQQQCLFVEGDPLGIRGGPRGVRWGSSGDPHGFRGVRPVFVSVWPTCFLGSVRGNCFF